MLEKECQYRGGYKQWSRIVGLSHAHVREVLDGWYAPSKSILGALGLRQIVTYEKNNKRDQRCA